MGIAPLLLFAASATADTPRDLCPDRPLGTPACTIQRGHVVVELGLVDWTLTRPSGQREDEINAGELLVRYGLAENLEVQVGWTAYSHMRVRSGNAVTAAGGTGDIRVAVRQNLYNPNGKGFSLAVMPYATLPTGTNGAGAGGWTAGLIVPMSYQLPHGFAIDLTTEAGAAVDQQGSGHHFAYSAILGFEAELTDNLGAAAELSAGRDEDPSGHKSPVLAGMSVNWTPDEALRFDVGGNVGLNRDAPDVELYARISRRF